jgi:TusE/DsrC/DsvC family sulfur relay protein
MAFVCDEEGYLLDATTWTSDFAVQVALGDLDKILSEFDWAMIAFVRDFYQLHHMMPLTRRIVSYARMSIDGFDSLQLQANYTRRPLWVLAKLSGLPKPAQCI